jgi:phosphate transport system permease protein
MKKKSDTLVSILIRLSGFTSTFLVFAIVFFLFREGIVLFNKKPVTENYAVVVHSSNLLKKINSEELKGIYDGKIKNWKSLGLENQEIIPFSLRSFEKTGNEELAENLSTLPFLIDSIVRSTPGIIAVLPKKLLSNNAQLVEVKTISIGDFFLDKNWYPTSNPVQEYGALPIILGTLWVTFGAILFALPLGISVAIYLSEIARPSTRKVVKPMIELLAGIPSVVYGFFGLVVLVPMVKKMFELSVGETALTGSILLGIIALPTIITIAEDAINNVPGSIREASLALGATQWQTILRVVIPYASGGITAGTVLGIGRAVGETMAVLMVTGNAAVIPTTFLEPVRTLPATIAAELGEAPVGGAHYNALFMIGVVLFVLTLGINLSVDIISRRSSLKLKR